MSREEEYLRRMKALGYEPSLAGMDDEDIEYEPEKMDRGQTSQPMETMLNRGYQPPDRDFAERIFKMFARPFDPKWKMPDLAGPQYRQLQQESRPESGLRPTGEITPEITERLHGHRVLASAATEKNLRGLPVRRGTDRVAW